MWVPAKWIGHNSLAPQAGSIGRTDNGSPTIPVTGMLAQDIGGSGLIHAIRIVCSCHGNRERNCCFLCGLNESIPGVTYDTEPRLSMRRAAQLLLCSLRMPGSVRVPSVIRPGNSQGVKRASNGRCCKCSGQGLQQSAVGTPEARAALSSGLMCCIWVCRPWSDG